MRTLVNYTGADIPVKWEVSDDGKTHKVSYGEHVEWPPDDGSAARWYGECVRHSLECANMLGDKRYG